MNGLQLHPGEHRDVVIVRHDNAVTHDRRVELFGLQELKRLLGAGIGQQADAQVVLSCLFAQPGRDRMKSSRIGPRAKTDRRRPLRKQETQQQRAQSQPYNNAPVWREVRSAGAGLVSNDDLEGTESLLSDWLELPANEREAMRHRAVDCFHGRFEMGAMVTRLHDLLRTTPGSAVTASGTV